MTQKTSPFVEGKYGWSLGEGGWNLGMDENLLKFSFLFDRNVDSITSSLPAPVNGQAHFLNTDSRLYFGSDGIFYSTPVPKWFTFQLRTTGQVYQYNGTALVQLESTALLSTQLDAVELSVTALQQFDTDIQNTSDITKGAAKVGYRGQTLFSRLNQVVNIKDAPFAVTGNNTTLDHTNLVACLDYAAAAGKPVIVPAGIYEFNDWISLPDKLKLIFEPGARWKLTVGGNALGGFVCGGYTQALVHRPFTDVEIYGIDLDCSDIPGQNAFNAINAVNVKVYNPKIRNVKFSPITQGGKAFQFEGDVVDGLHIYSPYIENCTIGINSHADPLGGTEIARAITYYNVVMRNVDVPFNCDGQFANPENGTVANMSTTVIGVNLFNCGRLTYVGNSGPLGSGIICGDRGYGLKVSGLRLVNTAAYGAISAVVRGTLFDLSLSDFKIEAPAVSSVVDLTPVGYGFPSSGAHVCTMKVSGMTVLADIDLIVKGYVNGKVGNCTFDVAIDSGLATLTGITDSQATFNGLGVLNLTLTNLVNFTTGYRTLLSLFVDGNTTAQCRPSYREGTWTPTDSSGAALAFVVSGTSRWVQQGRQITATTRFDYPTTANASVAKIGGLPFAASSLSTMAGAATIGYSTETTLARGYVVGGTTDIQITTSAGGTITNTTMSGDSVYLTVTYQVV